MAGDGQNPEQWSSADKFAVVLETAPLNAAELAAYCRRKGLLMEQLERWRNEVHTVLSAGQSRAGTTERATDKKCIRELERDLRRKEKALVETAALLVLSRSAWLRSCRNGGPRLPFFFGSSDYFLFRC